MRPCASLPVACALAALVGIGWVAGVPTLSGASFHARPGRLCGGEDRHSRRSD